MATMSVYVSTNFKILKCWRDDLIRNNFESQISISPKYLGGANLSSAITGPLSSLLQKYLCELLKAMEDGGSNVIGYSVWSLMDNFE
jgi:hypothetical protein